MLKNDVRHQSIEYIKIIKAVRRAKLRTWKRNKFSLLCKEYEIMPRKK